MGIPRLQELKAALDHKRSQTVNFMSAKPMRLSEIDWIEPKLSNSVTVLHMYMRGLGSFKTIKEEAKAGNPQHGGHY
jgi:hypothetical protein